MDFNPARAAYAAAEAAVFPVLAQMTVVAPRPSASLTAAVMPRSLNDPVGLSPSNLTNSSKPPPSSFANFFTGIKGVLPSNRVTGRVCPGKSSKEPYLSKSP